MEEDFGINDDRRRLYGYELRVESSKYNDAILGLEDEDFTDEIFRCIINEVLDLHNDERSSDEGITKGELHKRDRMRFASGVFKAFFDKKIIDEKQYDQLFRSLRENILKDYLGPNKERNKRWKELEEKIAERKRRSKELLDRGTKQRSGRVLD